MMDDIMQRLLLLVLIMAVSGCASFGRGVAEAIINDKKEDTRQCEIQGNPLPGIDDLFADKRVGKGYDGSRGWNAPSGLRNQNS